MERDTLLRRAAKLAGINPKNATDAEAMLAGELLAQLLRENNLSMVDVSAATMQGSIREEQVQFDKSRLQTWELDLAGTIAHACDCRLLKRGGFFVRIAFIGTEGDAALGAWFFRYLCERIPGMANRYVSTLPPSSSHRADKAGYIYGFTARIGKRLRDLLKPAPGEQVTSNTALTVIKKTAIDSWLKAQHPDLKKGRDRHRPDVCPFGVQAGSAAADNLALHLPIGTTSAKPLALTTGV